MSDRLYNPRELAERLGLTEAAWRGFLSDPKGPGVDVTQKASGARYRRRVATLTEARAYLDKRTRDRR